MIADGLNPGSVEEGDPNPTRQDCRTCHQVHTSYSAADWALTTTDPVDLYAYEDVTFDGGMGNLCVNCHQPRRAIDDAVDGMIEITSTHWGPHHGPQSVMLLGLGGGGGLEGSPSAHATMVEDTCVSCHLGEGDSHTFEPSVSACTACHADAEDFDINGVQTEVQAMLDELEEGLIALGWLDEEGHPAVTSVPEDQAAALWNWIYIAHEDKSLGVHNASYTKALLEAGLAALEE
jgi:cytochrome c551/c552